MCKCLGMFLSTLSGPLHCLLSIDFCSQSHSLSSVEFFAPHYYCMPLLPFILCKDCSRVHFLWMAEKPMPTTGISQFHASWLETIVGNKLSSTKPVKVQDLLCSHSFKWKGITALLIKWWMLFIFLPVKRQLYHLEYI